MFESDWETNGLCERSMLGLCRPSGDALLLEAWDIVSS